MERDALSDEAEDQVSILGLIKPLWGHRRVLVGLTLATTTLAALLSAIHYVWLQPTRRTASLEFRPVFKGADTGRYPNNLPFATADIIDPTVLDQVFDKNEIQKDCPRGDFHSGFFIERRSPELEVLDSEFQARLADIRQTAVDRQRLLEEYQARRTAAPMQFALTFVWPGACRTLSRTVVVKMLDDVLRTWASDSEIRRGVLKERVRMLTPNILDPVGFKQQSLFVRANLLWLNIDRVLVNVKDVESFPAAILVRFGEDQVTLAEIKARLEDLQHGHLEPLMRSVGGGERDIRWVEDVLATATGQQQVAQNRARASLDALREYSGAPQPSPPRGEAGAKSQGAADLQSLTPQIDRTFIDRILEMSRDNTAFRQDLTRDIVRATLDAVALESTVSHYKWLLASLKAGGTAAKSSEMDASLAEIVKEGKELVRQFNGVYDEYSRTAFRVDGQLYKTVTPGVVRVARAFSLATYEVVIILVLVSTLMLTVLGILVQTQLWPTIVGNK